MSAEQFQSRLSDLIFSAKEHIKELKAEQTHSENEHEDWENRDIELDIEVEEPDVIDNSSKVAAIEAAITKVEEAISELDKALEE